MMSKKSPASITLNELATHIGNFINQWGFKQVHGRIWAQIALSDTPLDAGELMKRLNISKALASMSLSDLLRFQVIIPHGIGSKGTQCYAINPDVMSVISNVLKERELRLINAVAQSIDDLETHGKDEISQAGIAPEALSKLKTLTKTAQGALSVFNKNCDFDLSKLYDLKWPIL